MEKETIFRDPWMSSSSSLSRLGEVSRTLAASELVFVVVAEEHSPACGKITLDSQRWWWLIIRLSLKVAFRYIKIAKSYRRLRRCRSRSRLGFLVTLSFAIYDYEKKSSPGSYVFWLVDFIEVHTYRLGMKS